MANATYAKESKQQPKVTLRAGRTAAVWPWRCLAWPCPALSLFQRGKVAARVRHPRRPFRCRAQQPSVDALRHADLFFGISHLCALPAAVAWDENAVDQWRWAWVIALFGLLYSLYLTSVAFFDLQATCPYCLTLLGLMATVLEIVATLQRPKTWRNFLGPWLANPSVSPSLPSWRFISLCRLLGRHSGPGRSVGPLTRRVSSRSDANFGASRVHCTQQKGCLVLRSNEFHMWNCAPAVRRAFRLDLQGKELTTYSNWIIKGKRYTGVPISMGSRS